MLSVLLVSGLLVSAPPFEFPVGPTPINVEKCSGSRCRDSVGFVVDFEVCEVLVENFELSKARKGTVTIEGVEVDGVDVPGHELVGVEEEIPFFFVHLDATFVGELVPRKPAKDESSLEGFIEVKVKDGRVHSENWHLSQRVMQFLTEDCEWQAARQ